MRIQITDEMATSAIWEMPVSMRLFERPIAMVAAAGLALGFGAPVAAQAPPSVTINGQLASFDPPPLLRVGRVYVPLRGTFERLGASVVYESGTINATRADRTVSLHISSIDATTNGIVQRLDAPPFIIRAKAYVPLRFLSQALGAMVDYDDKNRVVALKTAGVQAAENTFMSTVNGVIDWLAPLCFGVVIGWITYRTLRRAPTNGVSDLASVVGAVGGASITALFTRDHGDFSRYCIGLIVGFFTYLRVAMLVTNDKVNAWLGHDGIASQAPVHEPEFPKPE